eukprot:scaffold841_cov397-Prasinococcus_capsulatus_cf.AAC.4
MVCVPHWHVGKHWDISRDAYPVQPHVLLGVALGSHVPVHIVVGAEVPNQKGSDAMQQAAALLERVHHTVDSIWCLADVLYRQHGLPVVWLTAGPYEGRQGGQVTTREPALRKDRAATGPTHGSAAGATHAAFLN